MQEQFPPSPCLLATRELALRDLRNGSCIQANEDHLLSTSVPHTAHLYMGYPIEQSDQ